MRSAAMAPHLLKFERTGFKNLLKLFPCSSVRLVSSKSPTSGQAVQGTIPRGGHGVAVSQYSVVKRMFTEDDVLQFSALIQDYNPLHLRWTKENFPTDLQSHPLQMKNGLIDETSAKSTKPVVHGILVSSLFSSIFGTLVPGAVYLSQTLDFRRPVHTDECILGKIEVIKVRRFRRQGVIVTCDTSVVRESSQECCIEGKADVWLPGGSKKPT